MRRSIASRRSARADRGVHRDRHRRRADQRPAHHAELPDVEIGQVIEAVAQVTGKTIIPDPRVRAQVTMLSQTPMTPDAFYEAFLALLQVHQFVAVESGGIIKIVPDANARQLPNIDLPDRVSGAPTSWSPRSSRSRTSMPRSSCRCCARCMPQSAHLAAYPAGNILIISDRASNVSRMHAHHPAHRPGGRQRSRHHQPAARLVRAKSCASSTLSSRSRRRPKAAAPRRRGSSPTTAPTACSSAATGPQRLRIKALVAHLDTPLESGGDTQVRLPAVRRRRKDRDQAQGTDQRHRGHHRRRPRGGRQPAVGGVAASADRSTTIWAEPETNALVITAPAKVMRSLMAVIDKLDIRRAQVLVEAIIVDVQVKKNAELGVNWAVWSDERHAAFRSARFSRRSAA